MLKQMKGLLFAAIGVIIGISGTADDYRIVLDQDAIPSEVTAAKELQDGLFKITGVKLPVERGKTTSPAIRVGQSPENARLLGIDFAALKPDEIIIKTVGKDLIVAGDRPRGTLYAAFELLEVEYGVKFWTPAASYYPSRGGGFKLPVIDLRYAPPFAYREAHYGLHGAFAAKMKNNGHFEAIPGDWGGHLRILGWCHTFGRLIPARDYFKSHPEWFSELNGRRIADGQLCLTNPELRKELIRNTLEWIRKNPETRLIALSQNDNDLYCHCGSCLEFVKKHGNQTDLLLDAVNEAAAATEKAYPDCKIVTLAYTYTRTPPVTVRPRGNVIIQLCSIECDFSRPVDSSANASFARDINAWKAIAPELYIWNYITNFRKYYLPHPNWSCLAEDLRFFAAHNAHGVFEQGSGAGTAGIADLDEMRAWLVSKLLWNPQQDAYTLIDEFLQGYYGSAAPFIRQYIDLMTQAVAARKIKLECYMEMAPWLDQDSLIAAWKAMEKARNAVADQPELSRRVAVAALPINLALLYNPAAFQRLRTQGVPLEVKTLLDRQWAIARQAGALRLEEDSAGTFARHTSLILGLHGRLPREGAEPAQAKGLAWYGIPTTKNFRLFGVGSRCFINYDANGANMRSVRMPSKSTEWCVQYHQLPDLGEPFELYASLRCDGKVPQGDTVTLGVYDPETKQADEITVPAEQLAGNSYRLIKVADLPLKPGCFVFVAPIVNATVENIWIDRFVMIKK